MSLLTGFAASYLNTDSQAGRLFLLMCAAVNVVIVLGVFERLHGVYEVSWAASGPMAALRGSRTPGHRYAGAY